MAARWGAGEDTLLACHMDLFPLETLDEAARLSDGESVQSCIDPSILSIFEDMPTIETKCLDEESEATLLTALTEILDNVDDENLSPFDVLPDSDLLSKGREHSPLGRMLCQSRSPQKDSLCSTRPLSGGKSLSRMQGVCVQRSDGEEEEESSFTLSPDRLESPDLSGWEGLPMPLPVVLEPGEEEGLSVSLGDLVRHMHPYCMAISVENEEGEQMLPEGGIVLEVVDQGANGEPIFAIPNMELSCPLYELQPEKEEKEEAAGAEDELADTSEHIIVVDDEDDAPVRETLAIAPAVTAASHLDANNQVVGRKKERRTTSPSRTKKKPKEKHQSELLEGRVLRSGTVRRVAADSPKNVKEKVLKSKKAPSSPVGRQLPLKPEGIKRCKTEKENATVAQVLEKIEKRVTPLLAEPSPTPSPEESQRTCSAPAVSSLQPSETPQLSPSDSEGKTESSSAAPSVSLPQTSSTSPTAAPGPEVSPPISITPAAPEAKPKSLSLEQYRRLRQQKKPAPVEKQEKSVTKWPSLPELPKELPPLPHLPHPNPTDPRRANPLAANKETEEVKPAWRPRGPCAPPTPEALLQPPAYMISSSRKASAAAPAAKPQQTQDPPKMLQTAPPAAPADSVNASAAPPDTASKPTEPCVPQSFAPPASLKPLVQTVSSAYGECSTSGSGRKAEAESINPKSLQDTKVSPETTTDVHKPSTASGSVPSVTTVGQNMPEVTVPTSVGDPLASGRKLSEPSAKEQSVRPFAAFPVDSRKRTTHPAESKESSTAAMKPQRAKSNMQELIESFTWEMGIEAADLTSLLEQFEETQAKGEKCVPEVSGRAAAVGNSRAASVPEKAVVDCVRANDFCPAAAPAPKATPPNQMWKPLGPATQLGKSCTAEVSKPSPSKVIQIEAQPLPLVKLRSKATPAAASVSPDLACMDHDYCFSKTASPGEPGKRWNVKQQTVFTIKPLKQQPSNPQSAPPPAASPTCAANSVASSKTQGCSQAVQAPKNGGDESEDCSAMETPDASPPQQECAESPKLGPSRRSYRRYVASRSPSPNCSPKESARGRSRKRFYRSPSPTSSCSDAYSSRSGSRSKSPLKKRYRHRNSDSSLSSSSRSSSRSSPSLSRSPPRRRRRRYSYSSSRSGSWSCSRSRSRSPQRQAQWARSRGLHSPSCRPRYCHGTKATNVEETKRRKEKAIEERRVVYVGKIRGSMTQRELRERFSLFGEIEECTLHFRDHGDNYGFVTYYNTKDAFTAIENGSKMRKPDELPFDLCFGGRRQFCQSSYADLDSSREYEPLPTKGKYHALDFDTLLKQAQQNLKR